MRKSRWWNSTCLSPVRPRVSRRPDLGALAADIAEVQGRIKEAFYANLFLMLAEFGSPRDHRARDRRAARGEDADARAGARLGIPGRLHDELPQPLVARVFRIMARNGLIPPLPRRVDGNDLQVEFISILAQARKSVSTAGRWSAAPLHFHLGLSGGRLPAPNPPKTPSGRGLIRRAEWIVKAG